MGQLRSRHGCLTCRKRHVKCDEATPTCANCARLNRVCARDEPNTTLKFKRYRKPGRPTSAREAPIPLSPAPRRSESIPASPLDHFIHSSQPRVVSGEDGSTYPPSFTPPNHAPSSTITETAPFSSPQLVTNTISANLQPSPRNSNTHAIIPSPSALTPLPHSLSSQGPSPASAQSGTSPYGNVAIPRPSPLSYREAFCLHHFAEYLARWLDCTDASKQFSLNVPSLAKASPILLYAVVSYAARHVKDADTAEEAQQRCVELLIPLLSSESAANDEAVLCAIVILRVCEQLSVSITGSDQERHLAGFSALLKSSQGRELDPSTPTLSQAAFWVYVRQCLYNACVNQQPPNIDFDLVIVPPPPAVGPSVDVMTETAWANTVTWICATVIRYSFGAMILYPEATTRMSKWQELKAAVDGWQSTKPTTFEPLWYSDSTPDGQSPFPEIWFTSDWHVMAFGFYHLSCMLLAIYRPAPKFAVRNIYRTLAGADETVMYHARALCGACKSSPATVPALITLCHSAFIWGPLMTDERERSCVIKMLEDLESSHAWPTKWIIHALQDEWYS